VRHVLDTLIPFSRVNRDLAENPHLKSSRRRFQVTDGTEVEDGGYRRRSLVRLLGNQAVGTLPAGNDRPDLTDI